MATVRSKYVELQVEGRAMRAWLSHPAESSPRAALMVFQEAFGVNAHIRNVAERFAGEGYAALAPELFHRTVPGFEGDYANFSACMPHVQALTEAGMQADVRAAFEWIQCEVKGIGGKLGCVGYCMGGRVSFLANASVPVKAAVSYYGGGIAPGGRTPGLLDRAGTLNAPMLFFWGLRDQHIGIDQPRAVADALRQAGKTFVST
ncbi:MAG: dienelactone hydrolase family protein, partial [Terriglobia bacterium]